VIPATVVNEPAALTSRFRFQCSVAAVSVTTDRPYAGGSGTR
jgi:hypothetical protein